MKIRVKLKRGMAKRRGYSPGEMPRSIRWRGSNYDFAKKLAAREDRSLNRWINLTVERLWKATPSTEVIHK